MEPTTMPSTTAPPLLWSIRVAALLQLAAVLWEGATAGQLVTFNTAALPLHYYGAFGVHVSAGLLVVAAGLYWYRSGGGPGRPRAILLAGLATFLLGFPQAALGTYGPLQAHVPLALVLTGAAVWAAVLAWRRP
ncbi:hypothetical protein [Nocardiopsis tropica]|uniref:DUF423 domain-containing protein n=1 Tax=Nocardiopsis tropica TaxID=109330 RepID=A0ABU7KLL7_9ACTN|nr:hypothetical protein [Nocardiopsis umidischolae]MEE2049889.1 hypothetical protein [Nocardiopsis umidischolae]